MEQDELLDLVNDRDEVTGTIMRSEYGHMVAEKLGNVRAIDMFIINSQGELWIPKRPAHKKIAPNGLDYSCGGHVGSGESYIESALREIEEELNLKLTEKDLELVDIFEPTNLAYFRAVYVYRSDITPDYNPEDFVSAEWIAPQELIDKLDAGTPAKTSIRETVAELMRRGIC